ncbi:hypothetical protein [Vreelandella boliviensis]|uniref:hypothetical protein n=1 Tax=Vreelandella boliviensis TaxID=223527 RepID=UPI001B8AF603|nr:hypothetical protein [Halomonas boliviensis]MBS3667136.1 hypothetical protein [Halomonas boliviensis]
MPRVIYLGLFALPEHMSITLSALQQASEEVGALTLETRSTSQFEVLSNWLQQENKPGAVLIWPKPTGFIADCLAREEPIEGSLVHWKDMAKRLLKLFRRHRSQLTLLGMAPGETLTLSDDELPANITDVILQAEATVKRLPEATPLYRLAAAQLVAEDAELQDELAFLSASSHACSASTEQTSDTVRSALQSANESHDAKHQLKTLTQLISVQEALEVAPQQANNAASSQQTEQQLRKIIDERDSAQEENELLLSQLHIVQEALEEAYIELKSGTSEAESKRLNSLLAWLRAHARRHARAAYSLDSKALQEQISLLEQSEFFDAKWYLDKYKDVAKANINPAEHYIKFGAIEGRNPSPQFDTEYYVLTYPDITSSGLHPLLHYLREGIKEQRKTQESPA